MRKLFFLILGVFIFSFSNGQTKESTLQYLNNVLYLHRAPKIYNQIQEITPSTLKFFAYYANMRLPITHEFNPKDVKFVNITLNSSEQKYSFEFKENSVKITGLDVPFTSDEAVIANLVGMTTPENIKFKKALKYLFSLYGGNMRDAAF